MTVINQLVEMGEYRNKGTRYRSGSTVGIKPNRKYCQQNLIDFNLKIEEFWLP